MYQMLVLIVAFAAVSAQGGLDEAELWPAGTYGLFAASTGCPSGDVQWQHGNRSFDTEDTDAHNYFSPDIQNTLGGSYQRNDIVTNFCMKGNSTADEPEWPLGTYCILKFGDCPSGFFHGFIYWDDDDWGNHNAASGVLPDGQYNTNTLIYFCCRNDSRASVAIPLPRAKPFILMRLGPTCQSVSGMDVREVFVRWDDEDLLNSDTAIGAHPFDDGGYKDHKLHFCHYSVHTPAIG